jgi:tetratricopeptide (TPR) repeat protein
MTDSVYHTGDDIHVHDIKDSKGIVIGSGSGPQAGRARRPERRRHTAPPARHAAAPGADRRGRLAAFELRPAERRPATALADAGRLPRAVRPGGGARRAIEFYEQALVIAREIGERLGEGNALGNLGNAHADLGDAHQAIEFYEQQLVIIREIGDQLGQGNTLFNMSLSLDDRDQRAQAIANARSALKIYEQIESPYAERVRRQLAQWQGNG